MKIPFKTVDGRNVTNALVEIPERIFNMFPTETNGEEFKIDISHVKPNTFTRIFGEGAVYFPEEDKLPIPEAKSNGICVQDLYQESLDLAAAIKKYTEQGIIFGPTTTTLLLRLGFENRGPAKWWSPFFGPDSEENWMWFDEKTDPITLLIPKLYRSGYAKGQQKVRFEIKKALDISLI